MFKIFSRFLDLNQREVDRLSKIVDRINDLEVKSSKLKVQDFSEKTLEFKKRIQKGESLEDILPEAFALAREASFRAIGLKHYGVQLMAAVALFEGKIVEQRTGEGKTLSAVPALYLRALTGKGSHLVTVNDYLARRDAGWNGPIFALLGLSVGSIIQEGKSFIFDPSYEDKSHGDERLAHLKPVSRKEVYQLDVTYGTNNEFGFDYLRDNMVSSLDEMSQRGHYFAIVDEVDSVLIDEARTPLIISMPDTEPTDKYYKFSQLIKNLNSDTDYKIDEKVRSVSLTEIGIARVEKFLGVDNLYEKDFESIHHIENALRAEGLFHKDKDYVVKDNQIIIVDEFTGRLMFGRRWSDGLHQAVEAKEAVNIQQESKTLATISFQNYFRMYEHLGGMTGTATTEAEEFRKIYNLETVAIPTHNLMIRKDLSDLIYKTARAKYGAIVEEIANKHKKGQPVLVGTTSIEKNEIISEFLKRKGVPHNVLNAKNHEKEATIIAEAGKPGGVTVATNMAGRGVDIILGGAMPEKNSKTSKSQDSKLMKIWQELHDKVIAQGGLHVIGTERHESRRIDNQLRGRSGRQGDPGSSKFYLSLEDDLMRIFGGETISNLMDTLRLPENEPIENRLISRAIEQAQVKVEGFHFDARKSLVESDDVTNQQRDIIYKLRRRILESQDLKDEVLQKLEQQIDRILLESWLPDTSSPDYERILVGFIDIVPFDDQSMKRFNQELKQRGNREKVKEFLKGVMQDADTTREKQVGKEIMRQIEKHAYLSAIDHLWIDHIDHIEDLREASRLRAFGQRDPIVEFKNEAYSLFENLIDKIDEELAHRIFRTGAQYIPEIPLEKARENIDALDMTGVAEPSTFNNQPSIKLGRNDPCPCGAINPETGKPYKYKKCGMINAPYHLG